jgi:WD40 repeat protein
MRPIIAVCLFLAIADMARAADPKPLWELDVSSEKPSATASWLSYSPDGQAIAAVVMKVVDRKVIVTPLEYRYQLRVWSTSNRKERFTADLGAAETQHLGEDLASFPSDDTILTGGQDLAVRNLENGQITLTQNTGGTADHSVWAVPDLKESFYLRRSPVLSSSPADLFYQSSGNARDEFVGFRGRGRFNQQTTEQTTIHPPRPGLQTGSIALNFGRTHLVAAFLDDAPTSKPRHSLVMHEIKTVEEFGLIPVAEAENPHLGAVSAMAFARNGKTLATGGVDGSIALWDAEYVGLSWKPRVTLTGLSDNRVCAISFSRDWSMIAAVTWDKTKPNLLLIDGDNGKLLKAVRLERELTSVAFSPDGRTLLTGSATGKLRAWDIATLLKAN